VEWACTANLSVKRQIFFSVGGFDEAMWDTLYGEDVDLGIRLGKAGYQIASLPSAVVYHPRTTVGSFRASATKSFRCGRADALLQARYPERRRPCVPEPFVIAAVWGLCALFLPGWSPARPLAWLVLCLCWNLALGAACGGSPLHASAWLGAALGLFLRKAFTLGKLTRSLTMGCPGLVLTTFTYHPDQWLAAREREIYESWAVVAGSLTLALLCVMG
jgi:hypothetical protein